MAGRWAVVKTSAEPRLGKPLLVAYLVLPLVRLTVVAVSIAGPDEGGLASNLVALALNVAIVSRREALFRRAD